MKVCIPTKGRAGNVKTLRIFDYNDIILFVEPQEIDEYSKIHDNCKIVNILQNDKGISYVRNFILDYMNENFVMVDDDITTIRKCEGVKCLTTTGKEILQYLESKINNYSCIDIAHYNYSKPYRDKEYENFGVIRNFFAVNINKMKGFHFDSNVDGLEDLDMTIQLKTKKNSFLTSYKFICTNDFKTPGGCEQIYKESNEKRIKKMIEKWGTSLLTPTYRKNKFFSFRINYKHYEQELSK